MKRCPKCKLIGTPSGEKKYICEDKRCCNNKTVMVKVNK